MKASPDPDKYRVPSVEGACRILRLVCAAEAPLTAAQLGREAGLSHTTAIRITASLCRNRFLRRLEDGRIEPDSALVALDSRVFRAPDLRTRAVPVLKRLAQDSRETAHLAMPATGQALLVEVVDSPELLRVASRPGTLVDYHCSSTGKALLAFRPDLCRELKKNGKLTRRTPRTATTWKELEARLAAVRKAGYAVDDEEYHSGLRCLAAPVRDASGTVIAALGLTGSKEKVGKKRIPALALLVVAAANELSQSSPVD
jgi:IclR family acetate operon transcriptional repressor